MTTFVALLRGINVGGNRKVAMADLRTLFGEAGCTDVTTYIQSGNVVFTHPARSPDGLGAELERHIEALTGFKVAVVLRTGAELAEVVARDPFPDAAPTQLHVTFLGDEPPPNALDGVDAAAFAPEAFVLTGREIYMYLPDGMARTKLPKALDVFGTPVTTRNWRTVLKLAELSAA